MNDNTICKWSPLNVSCPVHELATTAASYRHAQTWYEAESQSAPFLWCSGLNIITCFKDDRHMPYENNDETRDARNVL